MDLTLASHSPEETRRLAARLGTAIRPGDVISLQGELGAGKTQFVKGFAVGRTIFADAADRWLSGRMTDEEAVADLAARFGSLVSVWKENQHVQTARKTAR